MDIRDRAHKYEYKLNDTDDQIIDYLVKNMEFVITVSIQALAKELYTVPNTITRLSKKLGYDGFSHLKNSLKEELRTDRTQGDSVQNNISRTLKLVDNEIIEKIVQRLCHSQRIYIYGVGDTLPFCEILSTHIKIGGMSTEHFLHRHDAIYAINHAKPQDLVILISVSGETKGILEVMKLAKEKGVSVVSITHFSKNSLERQANYRLFFYSPKKKLENYNVSDKTPIMLIIQLLSNALWEL